MTHKPPQPEPPCNRRIGKMRRGIAGCAIRVVARSTLFFIRGGTTAKGLCPAKCLMKPSTTPAALRGTKVINKDFLDKMYFRLYQRKSIRMAAKNEADKDAMKETELAIEMSIQDYIDTHQSRVEGEGE